MPRGERKHVRCPQLNKNIWVILEYEKDVNGIELLLCMTCKQKDNLERQGIDCKVECKNYFYSEN